MADGAANKIVKAKEYKVKDGDTLKSIADANGLTWQQLAKFNFGTDSPDDINAAMRTRVGCKKLADDGNNYMFTSQDTPGIIHIPLQAPQQSFPSNTTHQIKLKIPPANCLISSLTVAFSPADQARTKIGVGEQVNLTYSHGKATWTITSGGGYLGENKKEVIQQTTVMFTAGGVKGQTTIKASGAKGDCTITFNAVEPTNIILERFGNKLKHTNGLPDCGWLGQPYMQPTDVNFGRVQIREKDSIVHGTGSYSKLQGNRHGINYTTVDRTDPNGEKTGIWHISNGEHDVHLGTKVSTVDKIYAKALEWGFGFKEGYAYTSITWQWGVIPYSGAEPDVINNFAPILQIHRIHSDGKCESIKENHAEHTYYNDADSVPDGWWD